MDEERDMKSLLSGSVEAATDYLEEDSEFAPFAVGLQHPDGEIIQLEAEAGAIDEPAEEVVAALLAKLRADAHNGRWRAVSVVTDITVADDGGEPITSAIHIAIEHVEGDPLVCVVPYALDADVVELGEMVIEPGARDVFAGESQLS